MRAIFFEALIDIVRAEGLGIASGCLYHIDQLVTDVSMQHASELRSRATFAKAYADFEEFVNRMVRDAKAKNYPELHEDTFFAAKSQCGLIFWCA